MARTVPIDDQSKYVPDSTNYIKSVYIPANDENDENLAQFSCSVDGFVLVLIGTAFVFGFCIGLFIYS